MLGFLFFRGNIDFDFEELPKSSLFTSYFFIVYDLELEKLEFYIVIFVRIVQVGLSSLEGLG